MPVLSFPTSSRLPATCEGPSEGLRAYDRIFREINNLTRQISSSALSNADKADILAGLMGASVHLLSSNRDYVRTLGLGEEAAEVSPGPGNQEGGSS